MSYMLSVFLKLDVHSVSVRSSDQITNTATGEPCSILGDPDPFHNALLGAVSYISGNLRLLLQVTQNVLPWNRT